MAIGYATWNSTSRVIFHGLFKCLYVIVSGWFTYHGSRKGRPFFLRFYFVKKTEKLPLPVCTRTAFGSFPAEKSILFLLPQSEVFDYFSSQDQSGGRGDKGNAAGNCAAGWAIRELFVCHSRRKRRFLGINHLAVFYPPLF